MTPLMQTFQVILPLELFHRLQKVRSRYAGALRAAAAGDYSQERQLRAAAGCVGRLLAEEARKSPAERGGLPMLEISLAVNELFPELRGWNQYDMNRHQRERLRAATLASLSPHTDDKAS